MEFRHLTLHGLLLLPRRYKDDDVTVIVIPDPMLDATVRREPKPQAVGFLERKRSRGTLQGYLSLPQDSLSSILAMLQAGRLKFAILHGTSMARGGAHIRSYRPSESLNEDDLFEPE
jgi:hypothetical protein